MENLTLIYTIGIIYNILISYYAYKLDGGGDFTLRPIIVLFALTIWLGVFMNTFFVMFEKIK